MNVLKIIPMEENHISKCLFILDSESAWPLVFFLVFSLFCFVLFQNGIMSSRRPKGGLKLMCGVSGRI